MWWSSAFDKAADSAASVLPISLSITVLLTSTMVRTVGSLWIPQVVIVAVKPPWLRPCRSFAQDTSKGQHNQLHHRLAGVDTLFRSFTSATAHSSSDVCAVLLPAFASCGTVWLTGQWSSASLRRAVFCWNGLFAPLVLPLVPTDPRTSACLPASPLVCASTSDQDNQFRRGCSDHPQSLHATLSMDQFLSLGSRLGRILSRTMMHHLRAGSVSPSVFLLHHVSQTPHLRTSALLEPLVLSDARELAGTTILVSPSSYMFRN